MSALNCKMPHAFLQLILWGLVTLWAKFWGLGFESGKNGLICLSKTDEEGFKPSTAVGERLFGYYPNQHAYICVHGISLPLPQMHGKDFFPQLLCCDLESNSRRLCCISLKDLNSGLFTNWATVAVVQLTKLRKHLAQKLLLIGPQ